MTQHYSDPEREDGPHALPDVEVFWFDAKDIFEGGYEGRCYGCGKSGPLADGVGQSDIAHCLACAKQAFPSGWYYWFCSPGCMPDSDMRGPFESEEAALEDARRME